MTITMRYPTLKSLEDACYRHLESNLVEGEKWGLKYHFYRPAQKVYGPYQWLWDSGWHQIVWSHRNVENSIKDLRTMLQIQQSNGFIPEMIYWGKKLKSDKIFNTLTSYSKKTFKNPDTGKIYKGMLWTDITQMPMLPYSLRAIWNKTQDLDLLKEFLPKIIKYFEWWDKERDPDKDGLVSIIHPWESGLDASPIYDPAFGVNKYPINEKKYYLGFYKLLLFYRWKARWDLQTILKKGWFNYEDIGVCSCYADGWGVLEKLSSHLDKKLTEKCKKFKEFYSNAIINKGWDPKLKQFISFYHKGENEYKSTHETIQSLFPLLLDDLPENIQKILINKLEDPEKFGLPYPIPSTAKSDPAFNPEDSRLMWRGPSWGNTTWMVMEGLLKHGFDNLANRILDKWIEMYQKYGISEYHNPITGEMEGQEGLGMATTIVDMMVRLKRIS